MFNFRKLLYLSLTLIFIILAYFPIFHKLDQAPIQRWDESLFAMRAYHMTEEGSYLPDFNYFPGITPYRNLKPPLGTYFQAASFRLFGYNEFALRLPIAIFTIFTVCLLLFVTLDWYKNYIAGLVTGMILLTSTGYVSEHVVRTGDHDVLLTFFNFLSVYAFGSYILHFNIRGRRYQYLALLVISCLAAFFVKSIVGFFFFPAFFLVALFGGYLKNILLDWATYVAIATVILSITGYYIYMDHQFPEFFKWVWETVFGRYVEVRDNQSQLFGYYFAEFFTTRFWPWVFFLLLNPLALWMTPSKRFKFTSIFLWSCLLTHLLIISFSQTKLFWYDAAIYPLAALIIGGSITQLWEGIKHQEWIWKASISLSIVIALFFAYQNIWSTIKNPSLTDPGDKFAYLMKTLPGKQAEIKNYTVYCQEFNGQVAYYSELYNKKYGYDIEVYVYWQDDKFETNDYVLSCLAEKTAKIGENYQFEVVETYEECQLLKLGQAIAPPTK